MKRFPEATLRLPDWVEDFLNPDAVYPTAEDRMRLAVGLARENVEKGTGGPFGAAVFDLASNTLLAPGVNLVVGSGFSVAHAEVVAITFAQRRIGSFDLEGENRPPYELVASTEPCAMCLGATVWSGVRSLVCGARGEDAEGIGFDEGPKPEDWVGSLEGRGTAVACDVLRYEATAVLRRYVESGGIIYNGGRRG